MSAAQGVQYEKNVGMNPVSRLLSGTRLSAAIYGIIGTSFMIWACAAIVLAASAPVLGALCAAMRARSTAAFLYTVRSVATLAELKARKRLLSGSGVSLLAATRSRS